MKWGIKNSKLSIMFMASAFTIGATSNVSTWWADGLYALALFILIVCVFALIADAITDTNKDNEKEADEIKQKMVIPNEKGH